jgi:iron complex transport system substrate-binding protein
LKSGFVTIPLYYQKYNERAFIMKQRFKKHVALILISLMLLSLIGCGKPASTDTTTTTEAAVTEAPAASISDAATTADSTPADASEEGSDAQTVYPVTVTDQAGREVTIEKEPESIVSGYYISTSLLLALGLKDKVTGIEAIYKLAAPEFLELPNVGTAKEFDLETCASLSPELVILPMKLKDAAQSLSELDIPVLLVNPESEDQLEQMIELVSTATNTKENADALLSYIDEKKEMLEKDLSGVDAESVYLAGNSSLLSTAGPAMYQSGLIELAGGKNAASEITDTYWAEISYEQLLAWDPSYIILASDAEYTPEDVLNDENLKECTAVKNGNVYAIPGDIEALDSPVPGGILASIWLAGILHPDQVSADMYTEEKAAFYETFYGIK